MNARGQRTRDALIQATIDVVAEVGYARATTRAIAEAAGVAEGTIYRHYTDKRQLFFAAVFDRNAAVLDWVSGLPARAGTAQVRENLSAALLQLYELRADLIPLELALRGDPELARVLASDDLTSPELMELPGPPGFIAAYLTAEQQLGRIRAEVDAGSVSIILLAVLFGIGMLPSANGRSVHADLINASVDTILDGIATKVVDSQ